MSVPEIWLLAIGLGMDCLAVSIASGIIFNKIQLRPMLVMAFFFGFFQAIMPLLGWFGASTFSHYIENIDHWIAFFILFFLGIRMIREAFQKEECKKGMNPADLSVVITLAIATSIDALAIGVSFAFLNMNSLSDILPSIGIIGFVSFIMSICGLVFGSCYKYGHKIRVEFWGGLILIVIGAKILIEHLFLQ